MSDANEGRSAAGLFAAIDSAIQHAGAYRKARSGLTAAKEALREAINFRLAAIVAVHNRSAGRVELDRLNEMTVLRTRLRGGKAVLRIEGFLESRRIGAMEEPAVFARVRTSLVPAIAAMLAEFDSRIVMDGKLLLYHRDPFDRFGNYEDAPQLW